MGALKVFDADQVTLVLAGLLIDSGFDDGEFLRIEFETDAFIDKVGTDGEVTRSKTNDKRATATVLLAQSSSGNALLSALLELDQNAPNGAGVGAFLVKDVQGTSLYKATASWIMKHPDVSFDREATVREWPIRIADLKAFTGGN
jgi:hypothetical protein